MKKGDYSPPKGVVCHDNECRSFVPVCAINGGKVMYWGPLFEDALHRVLRTLDLMFKQVMNRIHIKDADGSVRCAEKIVWEDCDILIVRVSFDFIIWSS